MPNYLYRRAKLNGSVNVLHRSKGKRKDIFARTHKRCRKCHENLERKQENFALTATGRLSNLCVKCFRAQQARCTAAIQPVDVYICPVCEHPAKVHPVKWTPHAQSAMCKRCMLTMALLEHLDNDGVDRIAALAKQKNAIVAEWAADAGYRAFMEKKSP